MKDKAIKSVQRTSVLHNDLAGYKHRQWKINLPGRDYKVRPEDVVPAFAGTIGKISLAGAFAIAWMEALQITELSEMAATRRLHDQISLSGS